MKRLLLSLALFGAVPAFSVLPQFKAVAAPANGVAAEVNGDKIQLADLNRLVDSLKASDPSLSPNTPDAQQKVAEIRTRLLDEMITAKVLSQEAKREKLAPQPKQVDEAIAKLKSNFKSDAEFQSWVAADGQTVQDVRRDLADDMAVRELSTRLTADITVTPEDIAAYYRANNTQFQLPEAIHVHQILLAINPNASQADKDAVMNRARSLIKQIQAGAKFEDVAKANSDDPGSKDQGGDLPTFSRGDMIPSFEDAAFKAPVGQVVGPVTTEFGVHILRVDEKVPLKTLSLSDVQNDPQISAQIKAGLLKQKVQKRLDEQIAKLRAQSKIEKYA